ncbi:hypothetical protein CDD83_10574 [Cordyceps sp. RAO-2017]|nr:hypothetical protein CDD83_10574 [Cordyceps sp. RAO-2017]
MLARTAEAQELATPTRAPPPSLPQPFATTRRLYRPRPLISPFLCHHTTRPCRRQPAEAANKRRLGDTPPAPVLPAGAGGPLAFLPALSLGAEGTRPGEKGDPAEERNPDE